MKKVKLNLWDNVAISNSMIFMQKFYTADSLDKFMNSFIIHHFGRKEFTQLFGKHNDIFDGEGRSYIWIREWQGHTFHIFANSRKGTSYEIVFPNANLRTGKFQKDKAIGELIYSFIMDIAKQLLTLPEVQEQYNKLKKELEKENV